MKEYTPAGIVFFTSYTSRKAADLAENPHASILCYWPMLNRQVRIEGLVERVADADSESYWHRRPKDSQLSAACSAQSQPISDK